MKTGFTNITADLIYGIPTLTEEKWKQNLDLFFSFDIPHLSAYSLTVEPKTALKALINKNKLKPVEEAQSIEHFKILLKETLKHNFIHYEISNFAKEGFYSKHNSIYWLGGHYIGLGPSAHSFNGHSRQWNVSNIRQYVETDKTEKIIEEQEILTVTQQYNEYVMTSIRTSWGCDSEHIQNVFGEDYKLYFLKTIKQFINNGKVENRNTQYILSTKGKLFADAVAAELFY
jgi:oxygen-independent coproporphyrinogen-3 oxidase